MKFLALILSLAFAGKMLATQIFLAPQPAPVAVNSSLPAPLQWLAVKYPGNLPCACWPNLASHSNATPNIYTTFNYPSNVVRDTNCIIFNATGSTAIFQGYTHSNGTYAVPGVLITRRIILIRGHSNGDVNLGINHNDQTAQVYFYDRTNGIYRGIITNALGHVYDSNFPGCDYCLYSLTADVPTNIDVMPQIYAADWGNKFSCSAWPAVNPYAQPLLGCIYPASINLGYFAAVPGFSGFNVGGPYVGGTSGSPDMILIPTATGETLAMYEGRTTSGVSAQMLLDIAALNAASGLDNSNPKYQPVILDLSGYPNL